ncbi:MAG: hypothetical protein K9J37_07715 [Saprospiraceae bacterium]|nr:hypothetical protein [Saprospiraceae bacterium]MCF8249784.1 hypothetical protein [Saprospiraceae bacterium]MCF8279269.1 hypothetical protein [Bacteroidales bacterium]MCF8312817.1 hypothetical protein [Saprospiraceae bacterium]MCF8441264.1 hypothetical protein [Saprospiraceae bacterium]
MPGHFYRTTFTTKATFPTMPFRSFSGIKTSMPLPADSYLSGSLPPSNRTVLIFFVEKVQTQTLLGSADSSVSGR